MIRTKTNELLDLVQGNYGVLHAEMNVMVSGVGEGNRTAGWAGQYGRDRIGGMGQARDWSVQDRAVGEEVGRR